MAKKTKKESTKHKIIRVSTQMFLENGYTATTVKMVCDELKISKGNFTFYFPSKEDVLAELVEMLCEFQLKLIDYVADQGLDSVMSICIELMTVAAACAENEVAKDFFISAFQSPLCLEYLRNNHVERAKRFSLSSAVIGLMSSLSERKFLFRALTTQPLFQMIHPCRLTIEYQGR